MQLADDRIAFIPAPEETIGIPGQAGVTFDAKATPGALRVMAGRNYVTTNTRCNSNKRNYNKL